MQAWHASAKPVLQPYHVGVCAAEPIGMPVFMSAQQWACHLAKFPVPFCAVMQHTALQPVHDGHNLKLLLRCAPLQLPPT